MDAIVALCTCENQQQALKIANALVDGRFAACVNILPALESVYRWEGSIQSAGEVLLLIKTTQDRFSALRDRILELHSYETPEIIAVPVTAGSEKYLAWVREQV